MATRTAQSHAKQPSMRPVTESATLETAKVRAGNDRTATRALMTTDAVDGGGSLRAPQNAVVHERSGSERFAGLSQAFAAESGGSLQDRVFRALRGAILAGELPAG